MVFVIGRHDIMPTTSSSYVGSATSNSFNVIISINVYHLKGDIDEVVFRLLLFLPTQDITLCGMDAWKEELIQMPHPMALKVRRPGSKELQVKQSDHVSDYLNG